MGKAAQLLFQCKERKKLLSNSMKNRGGVVDLSHWKRQTLHSLSLYTSKHTAIMPLGNSAYQTGKHSVNHRKVI